MDQKQVARPAVRSLQGDDHDGRGIGFPAAQVNMACADDGFLDPHQRCGLLRAGVHAQGDAAFGAYRNGCIRPGMPLLVEAADAVNRVSPDRRSRRLEAVNRSEVTVAQILRGEIQGLEQVKNDASEFFFPAAGPHGHGFGLMADGVDRTGQFVNGGSQSFVQQIERMDQVFLSVKFLPDILHGQFSGCVLQQKGEIGDGFAAQRAQRALPVPGLKQEVKIVDDPAEGNVGHQVENIKNR